MNFILFQFTDLIREWSVCAADCFLVSTDPSVAGCGICCQSLVNYTDATKIGGLIKGSAELETSKLSEVPSGQAYPIIFAIVDHYGTVVKTDSSR